MARMYDRPTLGPDGWVVDETPTPAPLAWSLDASGNPVGLYGPDGEVAVYLLQRYTWALRPPAADNAERTILITDVGPSIGSRWVSDGVYWKPENGLVVLQNSAAGLTVPSDTNENVLAECDILALMMATNGRLRITTSWECTNSANTKIIRIRFGGSAGTTHFYYSQTTNVSGRWITEIQNADATNSQVGGTSQGNSNIGVNNFALQTSAIDTSVNTSLVISGQKSSAGETFVLKSYLIELVVS